MPTPEEIAEALWRSRTHLPHVKICNERDLEEIARVAAAIREAVELAELQRDDYKRTIGQINNGIWKIMYPDAPESWEYVTQPLVHIRVEVQQLKERLEKAVLEERERCKQIHQEYIDKSNLLHYAAIAEEREACARSEKVSPDLVKGD